MNLPNKLTVLRVAAVPAIVVLLYIDQPACRIAATVLFLLACVTDWLDGFLARKQGIVTDFGKFLDPVADKLLVLCTMIALAGLGQLPAWVSIVVLFRELMVDGPADGGGAKGAGDRRRKAWQDQDHAANAAADYRAAERAGAGRSMDRLGADRRGDRDDGLVRRGLFPEEPGGFYGGIAG